MAKIFDPLGTLGPLSIRAKLLIQKLWQLKIDWDETIPIQLHSEWLELRSELEQVGLLFIPRHVLVKKPKLIEIVASIYVQLMKTTNRKVIYYVPNRELVH